jgi:hypothetical protein
MIKKITQYLSINICLDAKKKLYVIVDFSPKKNKNNLMFMIYENMVKNISKKIEFLIICIE